MLRRAIFILSFAMLMGGCSPLAPVDLFEQSPAGAAEAPAAYEDGDWESVLRDHVRDGAVDYQALAHNPVPLQHYLALVARTGPTTTPEAFTSRTARLAYYLNVYNACVLRAVLSQGIPGSMYAAGRPALDDGYRFRVDGETVTLARLRELARSAAEGDARVELALCDAARGSPALAPYPFRAYDVRRRLHDLAADALGRPNIARVDHEARKILLARALWAQRQALEQLYRRETGSASSTLLGSLMHLAGSAARERLARGTGYPIRPMPFDTALNAWNPPPEQPKGAFPFLRAGGEGG